MAREWSDVGRFLAGLARTTGKSQKSTRLTWSTCRRYHCECKILRARIADRSFPIPDPIHGLWLPVRPCGPGHIWAEFNSAGNFPDRVDDHVAIATANKKWNETARHAAHAPKPHCPQSGTATVHTVYTVHSYSIEHVPRTAFPVPLPATQTDHPLAMMSPCIPLQPDAFIHQTLFAFMVNYIKHEINQIYSDITPS